VTTNPFVSWRCGSIAAPGRELQRGGSSGSSSSAGSSAGSSALHDFRCVTLSEGNSTGSAAEPRVQQRRGRNQQLVHRVCATSSSRFMSRA
jgi:hypothetical protein